MAIKKIKFLRGLNNIKRSKRGDKRATGHKFLNGKTFQDAMVETIHAPDHTTWRCGLDFLLTPELN